ncbi:hypothetical protein IAT40_003549 [Kwoniella sp. CBS 6097]
MSFSDLISDNAADLLDPNPVSSSPTFSVGPEIPSASQPLTSTPNENGNPNSLADPASVETTPDPNNPSNDPASSETASTSTSLGDNGLPLTSSGDEADALTGTSSTPLAGAGLIPSTTTSTPGVSAISSILSPSNLLSPSTHLTTLFPSSPSTAILGLTSSVSIGSLLTGSRSTGLLGTTLTSGLLSNSLLPSTGTLSQLTASKASPSQSTTIPTSSADSLTAESSSENEEPTPTDSPSESLVPIVVTSTGDDTTLFISMTSTVAHSANASKGADLAAANSDDKTEGNILNSDNKLFPLGVVLVVIGGLIVVIASLVFCIRCFGITRRRRRLRAAIPSFFPTIPEHDHSHYNDPDPDSDGNEKYNHIASTEYLNGPQAAGGHAHGQPAYEEYVIGSTKNGVAAAGGDWYNPSAGAGTGVAGGHQRNRSDGSFGNDISSALGNIGAGAAGVGAGAGAGGYGGYPALPQPVHAPSPPRGITSDPYANQNYTYDYAQGQGQDTGPYPGFMNANALPIDQNQNRNQSQNQYPSSDPYGGAYFPAQGQGQGQFHPGQRNLTPTRNNSQSSNGSSCSYGSDSRLAYQEDSGMQGDGGRAGTKDKIRQMGYF